MMARLAFFAALVLAAIGIVMFYQRAAVTSRSQGDVPVYSDQRYDPYGTAALRDMCVARGIPVRSLERPRLDESDHGVLIEVLPLDASTPDRWHNHLDKRELLNWISQGNTVIQFSRCPTQVMTERKIFPTTQPTSGALASLQDFESHGDAPEKTPAAVYLAPMDVSTASVTVFKAPPLQPLLLWSPMRFAESNDPAWTPLARLNTSGQEVVAGELRIGQGKLVLIGAPTPALNGTLGQFGNLDFLLDQIGAGPVILDEWSHGIGQEATIIRFLHDVGLLPFLLQLGFIAAVYIWSTSGFPRRDEFVPVRQRSSIEQIQTLGFLYSRSLDASVSFNRVNAEVQRRVAEALRCQAPQIKTHLKRLKPALRLKFEQLFASLDQMRPANGPRCQSCGYDLYLSRSERCPECGIVIPVEVRRRIVETATSGPPGNNRQQFRLDAAFAQVLTLSHQLTREVQRDRRAL